MDPGLSAEACREKAEQCLALSEEFTDPRSKAALLKMAEWWMRIAEFDRSVAALVGSSDEPSDPHQTKPG